MNEESHYLHFLLMLFITLFIVCEITAFRMTYFFGFAIPTSGLIIPLVFMLGDICAEVYGYHVTRKLIWNALVCQLLFGVSMTLILYLPTPANDQLNTHFLAVFEHIIRTNLTSCVSVTSGMFTNAFLISKLKIYMQGRKFWGRTIISSSISEAVLCIVAYVFLFIGLKEIQQIGSIIFIVWLYKVVIAFLLAPFASLIAYGLKRVEGIDTYDIRVNYNPFKYNIS